MRFEDVKNCSPLNSTVNSNEKTDGPEGQREGVESSFRYAQCESCTYGEMEKKYNWIEDILLLI